MRQVAGLALVATGLAILAVPLLLVIWVRRIRTRQSPRRARILALIELGMVCMAIGTMCLGASILMPDTESLGLAFLLDLGGVVGMVIGALANVAGLRLIVSDVIAL